MKQRKPLGPKLCARCGPRRGVLPPEAFYRFWNETYQTHYLQSYCKECSRRRSANQRDRSISAYDYGRDETEPLPTIGHEEHALHVAMSAVRMLEAITYSLVMQHRHAVRPVLTAQVYGAMVEAL